jgi:hypothetical protein
VAGPPQHRDVLLKIAGETCAKLFSHYGFPLRLVAAADPARAPVAFHGVIGFSGKGIRGRLILGSSIEPLEACNPARSVPARDWLGELSNQLLGRIKNQLLLYRVELSVTTPLIVRASHMPELNGESIPSVELEGASGRVRVWLDLSIGAAFQMAAEPDPSLAGPLESETVFF